MKTLKSTLLLLAVFCAGLSMQSCEEECENGTSITDCESVDPTETEVQVLLDGGKTPLELVNEGIPLNSLYGKMYAGGFIFYFNANDGSGLVAATEDQNLGTQAQWGCNNQGISGADGEGLGTGAQNSIDILAGCNDGGIAARLCNQLTLNGYTDWFLPSKDALNLMWHNLADSDGDDLHTEADIVEFDKSFYWSSTEFSDGKAWIQFFSSGSQLTDSKRNTNTVRAVRAF